MGEMEEIERDGTVSERADSRDEATSGTTKMLYPSE